MSVEFAVHTALAEPQGPGLRRQTIVPAENEPGNVRRLDVPPSVRRRQRYKLPGSSSERRRLNTASAGLRKRSNPAILERDG